MMRYLDEILFLYLQIFNIFEQSDYSINEAINQIIYNFFSWNIALKYVPMRP